MRVLCLLVTMLALPWAGTCLAAVPVEAPEQTCVILLHGLIRSSNSMSVIDDSLQEEGYIVVNQGYPSRDYPIEDLSALAINEGLDRCHAEGATRVDFVTHSLGGILVRQYLSENKVPELGRVVMLSPPNKGSTLINLIEKFPKLEDIIGPAGHQLGTNENSVPLKLGPADYEVGIITGDHTVNPLMSAYLGAPSDGKVTVESARLEGMSDFLVMPHSHPFIMRNDDVIRQVIHFLESGKFERTGSE